MATEKTTTAVKTDDVLGVLTDLQTMFNELEAIAIAQQQEGADAYVLAGAARRVAIEGTAAADAIMHDIHTRGVAA